MKEAIRSSVTPVLTRVTRRIIPEDAILHSHRRENLKSCEDISVRRLLVAACGVSSSSILVTLMKEAPSSSETSVLTRATRRNIPEDTFLLCQFCFTKFAQMNFTLQNTLRCILYSKLRQFVCDSYKRHQEIITVTSHRKLSKCLTVFMSPERQTSKHKRKAVLFLRGSILVDANVGADIRCFFHCVSEWNVGLIRHST
jgi:hypothetical protein